MSDNANDVFKMKTNAINFLRCVSHLTLTKFVDSVCCFSMVSPGEQRKCAYFTIMHINVITVAEFLGVSGETQ